MKKHDVRAVCCEVGGAEKAVPPSCSHMPLYKRPLFTVFDSEIPDRTGKLSRQRPLAFLCGLLLKRPYQGFRPIERRSHVQ